MRAFKCGKGKVMKIGLIDVDGHNFPNLALMKISTYHKALGDSVEMYFNMKMYDKVYVSKVFTFTPDFNCYINADEVVYGGTGYDLKNKLPPKIEKLCPDYSLYPRYKEAYGYLTRGCPRNCPFCIVTKKEGCKSIKVADLSSFYRGQKTIKLLDPNILACDNHGELLRQLADSKAKIDFTQGLDARLINSGNVELLSKIKVEMIHFAFDLTKDEKKIIEGLRLYKEATLINRRKTSVYILTNYNTTHEEDLYRLEVVKKLDYNPFVMIYNKESAPQETIDLARWANKKQIYERTERDFSKYEKKGVMRDNINHGTAAINH